MSRPLRARTLAAVLLAANDVLNPAFHGLTADDFEVIVLGWGAPASPP